MMQKPITWWTLIFCCTCSVALCSAQEQETEKDEDVIGWHVVQQGEILESITEKYLGYKYLWRENWKLNPHIKNPHKLRIGERIKVYFKKKRAKESADVLIVRREVNRKTDPHPWTDAKVGDQLQERDSLRTREKAYSELLFGDGTKLQVTEKSLVFLQTVERNLRGVHRESVHIQQGQVDLVAAPKKKRQRRSDIEIIIGDALTKPAPDQNGNLGTRSRRSELGHAEVMVFAGNTAVEAAGTTVDVPSGMGTVVEKGKPPAPPTKLPTTPRLSTPKNKASFVYLNPELSWESVPEANRYRVGIYGDEERTELVASAMVTEPKWRAQGLSEGQLYWTVIATNEAGLDSKTSRSRSFNVKGGQDVLPPAVVAQLIGPGTIEGDRIILGAQSQIRLLAFDDAAGVARIEARWNSSSWFRYKADLSMAENRDETLLEFKAMDYAGKWSEVYSVTVVRGINAPDAPTLQKR